MKQLTSRLQKASRTPENLFFFKAENVESEWFGDHDNISEMYVRSFLPLCLMGKCMLCSSVSNLKLAVLLV